MANKCEGEAEEQAKSRGQPIHTVDEIDDVGDGDEPKEGDREPPPSQHDLPLAKGVGQAVDRDAQRVEDAGGTYLTDKLDPRPQRTQIVREAHGKDEQIGEDDRPPLSEEIWKPPGSECKAQAERHEDRKPAQSWHWCCVQFPMLIRMVHAQPGILANDEPGAERTDQDGPRKEEPHHRGGHPRQGEIQCQ